MDRPPDLPEFADPPVDEVVVGVFHDRIDGYGDGLAVKLMMRLADRGYENFEVQDRLMVLDPDPATPPEIRRAPQIQVVEGRDSRACG